MLETQQTLKALQIAQNAHENQTDKAGEPYIQHPLAVAESMESEDEVVVALLHDVVEDSDWTLEDLHNEGFSGLVVEAVAALTHDKDIPYLDYIRTIKEDPIAKRVKIADLKHNMDITRIKEPTEADRLRIGIYKQALEILEG